METKYTSDGKSKSDKPDILSIFGGDTRGLYTTRDPDEYETMLKQMNVADLQTHSIKAGIKPNKDRPSLIKILKKEFVKNNTSYHATTKKLDKKLSKEKTENFKEISNLFFK